MLVIKPDYARRITLEGVAAPVPRPVDIDESITGFTALRTLRIYHFTQGSVIDGHAEGDEVFIVVLEGSVSLTMTAHGEAGAPLVTRLNAPNTSSETACAAYLPPQGAYQLTALTNAEVAYARATPLTARPLKVFASRPLADTSRLKILLEEISYAERLRLRLVQFGGEGDVPAPLSFELFQAEYERLVHFKTISAAKEVASLRSNQDALKSISDGETLVIPKGEQPALQVASGSSGFALLVFAM